jgi:hypothetical protein
MVLDGVSGSGDVVLDGVRNGVGQEPSILCRGSWWPRRPTDLCCAGPALSTMG